MIILFCMQTTLSDSGVISDSDVSDLKDEMENMDRQTQQEDGQETIYDLKKNMKNKMAEKRRRKMKKLQHQHDKDLEKVNDPDDGDGTGW